MQMPLQDAFALALAHEAAGRPAQARQIYEQILSTIADQPGALLKIAEHEFAEGMPDSARERLQRALAAASRASLPQWQLWSLLGRVEIARKDREAARRAFEQALADAPDRASILARLGHLELELGRPESAERQFRAGLAAGRPSGPAVAGLALALAAQGHLDEALATVKEADAAVAQTVELVRAHAWILLQRGNAKAAQGLCAQGLTDHPNDSELVHLEGQVLKSLGALREARRALERAAELAPDNPHVHVSLGAACLDLGAAAEAQAHFERAIELGAAAAETWDNLGLARWSAGELAPAIDAFREAVRLNPALTPALANLASALQYACAWDELDAVDARLDAVIDDPRSDPRLSPFVSLTLDVSPQKRLAIARRWSAHVLPAVSARAAVTRSNAGRLRVGYLSSDLRTHPMARLLAGLFERTDRKRFECFAYSHGADDGSALRRRLIDAFEHWTDAQDLSDEDLARRISHDGIDVLVDLNGHTHGGRLGILARRPAPVQLHYMGFPGTLGYDAIDALVADAIVIPPGSERDYHEEILRLPRCYFVTDGGREAPQPAPRTALGLAEDALVLACFNQPYKLSRRFFGVWLEALAHEPSSLLWLLAPDRLAQANLRSEAERGGVDPRRLLFAAKLPQGQHLARLGAADLALDLLPYGSHTTGADALWAGVPLLTCRGDAFAGRVGSSLVQGVGMPELVTASVDAYRATLFTLVADRPRLRALKEQLAESRTSAELFDTEGFTRDWEYAAALSPQSVSVGSGGCCSNAACSISSIL